MFTFLHFQRVAVPERDWAALQSGRSSTPEAPCKTSRTTKNLKRYFFNSWQIWPHLSIKCTQHPPIQEKWNPIISKGWIKKKHFLWKEKEDNNLVFSSLFLLLFVTFRLFWLMLVLGGECGIFDTLLTFTFNWWGKNADKYGKIWTNMGYDQQPLLPRAKYADWGMRAILKAADTSKVVSKVDSKDKEEEPPPTPFPWEIGCAHFEGSVRQQVSSPGTWSGRGFFSGVHQWVKVLWELGRGRFWHRQHQTKSSLGEGQLIEPPIHLSHNIHFYISFSLRLFSQKHCDGSVWGDQHDGACLSDPLLLAHPRGNNNHDHTDQNVVPVVFT